VGADSRSSGRNARQLKASLSSRKAIERCARSLRYGSRDFTRWLNEAAIERAGIGPLAAELASAARIQSHDALAETIARCTPIAVEAAFGLVRVAPDDKQTPNFWCWPRGARPAGRDFYLMPTRNSASGATPIERTCRRATLPEFNFRGCKRKAEEYSVDSRRPRVPRAGRVGAIQGNTI